MGVGGLRGRNAPESLNRRLRRFEASSPLERIRVAAASEAHAKRVLELRSKRTGVNATATRCMRPAVRRESAANSALGL